MASPLSFTGFVWKKLRQRQPSILPTLCGMEMVHGAMVVLVGSLRAFEQGWQNLDSSRGTDLAVMWTAFRNPRVDEAAGARLKALPEWLGAKLSPVEALRYV
jgi:hypothetical protein